MISINKNFLTPEEVNAIINYIEYDTPKDWNATKARFWHNRTFDLNSINNANSKDQLIIELIVNIRKRIIKNITEIQGITVPIYGDTLQIVRWPKGYEQPPHSDCEQNNPEDGEHPYPHRIYSSICYLNDDFEGGELYFPQHNLTLKPEPGMMVEFSGTREYLHGVRPVINGIRYTIISFYTTDINKADNWTI